MHSDEFERLLREKSDEFRMYPSKRIWHSIYNNIHPARKWPSVAMTISLISSLFLIGYLNTKHTDLYSLNEQDKAITSQAITSQYASHKIIIDGHTTLTDNLDAQKPLSVNGTITRNTPDVSINKRENNLPSKLVTINTPGVAVIHDKILTTTPGTGDITFLPRIDIQESEVDKDFPLRDITHSQKVAIEDKSQINNSLTDIKLLPYSQSHEISEINQKIIINVPTFQQPIQNDNSVVVDIPENATKKNKITDKTKLSLSLEDQSWIENYALYNRPAAKKWANKLAVQMYATPSLVYRILLNEPETGPTQNTTPFVISSANQDINEEVIQTPSYGFEIGTGLQYFLLKGVKLKGGLQLNYTRYNSHAFQNTHPVVTKLTMHDLKMNSLYEVYKSTPYSNKSGLEAVRLHNETFQISLPIGADFRLLGNENLQWNFGVTIQPTYVIGGKSYLISSDRRNYVKESSMLNRWNMNAGFETFITYQLNGLTWQVGPQFRSQLFSTNSRKYAVEEKLLNFGLKFGVTKTLK